MVPTKPLLLTDADFGYSLPQNDVFSIAIPGYNPSLTIVVGFGLF